MAEQVFAIDVSNYVRGAGEKARIPVDVVSTTNVDLSTDLVGATIDGQTLVAGWRILLVGQSTGTQNGVYKVVSGAGNTYRDDDYIGNDDVSHTFLCVTRGTTYINTEWHAAGRGETTDVGNGSLNFVMKNILDYAAGDIFYANSSNTLTKLSKPNQTSLLEMNASGTPQWIIKDHVLAGLDPKESVRFATLDAVTGTYNPTGGSSGTGFFSGVDFTNTGDFDLDGNTVQSADRILVKNQADPKQNGIYYVTIAGGGGNMERAADQDGTPTNEVSAGNFTFVELGATYANTGWILQGDGVLTLNTDNLVWTQFNAQTSFTAGDGLDLTGSTFSADLKANGGLVIESTEIAVDLGASNITGTLAVGDGGTGQTTLTSGALVLGNGTSAVNTLAPTSRKVLISNSTPAYALSNTINLSQINGASDDLALLKFSPTASAVKEFTISNSAAGGEPTFSATSGTQTNVSMQFQAKGTGVYNFLSTATAAAELRFFEDTDDGTNYVGLKAGAIASNLTFTLPTADGAADGYVLKTDGATNLSFINPDTSFKREFTLRALSFLVTPTSYADIAIFTFNATRYGASASFTLIYECTISGANLSVRVFDNTNTATLATDAGIAASGFRTLAFTAPAGNARILIQVKRDSTATAPNILGINLGLN